MRLRVRIPDAPFDPHVACSWVLHDPAGRLLNAGDDLVTALPAAARVELIAPASRVLLTQTALPKRGRQRLREVLRFAVEDRITVEPERVHVALGPRVSDSHHAVAVVDRNWLREWIDAFSSVNRAPRSVFVETCLPPLDVDAWTLVRHHEGAFVRTGPASGMALDIVDAGAPPSILMIAMDETRAARPAALLICAEPSDLPDLDGWSMALGTPCIGREAWDWTQAQSDGGIDLLQGEFAPPAPAREFLPRLRPALVIAALILAVHIFGTVSHWAMLKYEKSQLQTQMLAVFRTAFPAAQVVDPPLQMRRQLDALKRVSGEAQAGDFVPLLAQAVQALAGQSQRVRSVSYDRTRLSIDVELGTRPEAEALVERLKAGGAAARLDAVNPRGQGIDARISFTAKSGA